MQVGSFLYVLKTFRLKMSIFQNRAKPTRWIFRSGVLPVDTGWEAGIHPGMPCLTTIPRGHSEFPVSHVCVFGLCEVTGAPWENYRNPGRGDELGHTEWKPESNLQPRRSNCATPGPLVIFHFDFSPEFDKPHKHVFHHNTDGKEIVNVSKQDTTFSLWGY